MDPIRKRHLTLLSTIIFVRCRSVHVSCFGAQRTYVIRTCRQESGTKEEIMLMEEEHCTILECTTTESPIMQGDAVGDEWFGEEPRCSL